MIEGILGTLSDADRYCGQHRSRILTIQSEEEQHYLEHYLFNESRIEENVWIGGQRENLRFAWRNDGILIDGRVYSNWATDRPSRVFARACLQLNSPNTVQIGKWSDEYCFAMNVIVCEKLHIDKPPVNDDVDETLPNTECGCKDLEKKIKELENRFDNRFEKLSTQLEYNKELVKKHEKRFNEVSSKIEEMEDALNGYMFELEQLKRLDFSKLEDRFVEISNNFTSITNVFDYLLMKFSAIEELLDERGNEQPVNLNDLKDELLNYINDKLNNAGGQQLNEVINDAKLSYVNYRRALLVKKNGKWVQLGFV